ncbi:MAG: hypothetical protein JEZ00_15440 [Anaerolineaceae bacterium]|nr:hypothetical protein [Anaerolineaceae bacterium]
MKRILYTIIGYSFSLAAALGILCSLTGIILVWRFVPAVSDRLVDTASFAQRALDSTEELLDVADNTLTDAEDNITLIAEATQDMAGSVDKTATIAASISDTMENEFSDIVENTQSALTSLEGSAKLVDDTLSFVAAIPFLGSKYSNQTPLYNSVVGVNQSLTDLPDNIFRLQENLEETSSAFTQLNESLQTLSDSMSEIETSLEDANAIVESYQILVDEAQTSTARVIGKLPAWIRWFAAGLSVLFVWTILIQAGLLLYVWDLAALRQKKEDIPPSDTDSESL